MAYVPLPSPARAALLTRAEARWTRLGARRPDLEPAIKVQRALIALTLDLLDAVEAGDVPAPSLPPRAAAEKLGRGTPLLVAEPVPVPVPILGPSLGRYCELLASGGASPAALN